MEPSRPSQTALTMATLRAAHQLLDQPPIFIDPLALPILGPGKEEELRAQAEALKAPGPRILRATSAVRNRYAEDALAVAVAGGVDQYVLLGAGLDTFAYRNPHAGLGVIEVDHPATQAWKRELLTAAGIAIPSSLAFAAVDFEMDTLADGLTRAGFAWDRPALFALLGVSMYLTVDALTDVLRLVGGLPTGSGVILDYILPPEHLTEWLRAPFQALTDRVAAQGEPWRTLFTPDTLTPHLEAAGLVVAEDVGPAELNPRYFTGRDDALALVGVSRLVHAQVAPTTA
ncbi:MAG: class I SAM-dependent methyltransferase [Azospirillaceae bacterium]|nr:class I SAM-dependent methyltransferase [Azospirillaceae bacterium]